MDTSKENIDFGQNNQVGEFDINKELFANRGAIGRREFIINFIIIIFSTSFFFMPFIVWAMMNYGFSEYININKLYFSSPLSIQLLYLFASAFVLMVGLSNIKRRLNDILAKPNTTLKITAFTIFSFAVCSMFFPLVINIVFGVLNTILFVFLCFKGGKITSKIPHDPMKAFNFGAFFGTWIWGLFNKSYKTLWMLLFGLTPYGIFYALYCGFKGNRWAYETGKVVCK